MPQYQRKDKGVITAADAAFIDSTRSSQFLNPIAMSQLQRAVREKKKEAVLDGIRYSLSYGHVLNYPASGETSESVRLKRTDGQFVPFGYVSLKRIENFDFENGE